MTATDHSDHPGEHAKATAANYSGQKAATGHARAILEAASGSKTATGHTETTRANAMKPLAVQRPPTTAPQPHKGKQQSRQATPTASGPPNREQKAERQREQQDRS